MPELKAFLADVDDTICPSTQPVSQEMATEITRLVNAGKIFSFISGSTLDQISAQLSPSLKVPHQLLAVSGSHFVKVEYRDDVAVVQEVLRRTFDEEVKARILKAMEGLIRRYDLRSLTSKEDQLQDRQSQVTLSVLGRNAPDDAKRAFDPDGARRREWIAELTAELGGGLNIRSGGTTSIDVTPAGVDKEWGIRRFLEHNDLRPEETVFFGDNLQEGGNDFPATKVVPCVAVRNPSHTLELLRGYV